VHFKDVLHGPNEYTAINGIVIPKLIGINPVKGIKIKRSYTMADPNETLQILSEGDLSVLDVLMRMTEGSLEESGLDPETFMLVRIAALATLDAAPASWLMNLKVSGEAGVVPERVIGTLIAIAPVIGTARVVAAAGHIVEALGLAAAIAEDTN
jgi:4-carboxymuconolactone decarboxylase